MMGRNRNAGKPGAKNPGKTFKRIMAEIMGRYKLHCVAVVLCLIVSAVANVYGTMFMQRLIDDYITPMIGRPDPDFGPMGRAVLGVALVYLLGAFSAWLYNYLMIFVSQGTLKNLRVKLFSKMERLPIKYFDTHAHGDIMSVYTNDIDTMRQMISQSMPQLISSVVTIVSIVTSMIILNVPLLIITLFMVATTMTLSVKRIKSAGRFFVAQQQDLGRVNGYIEEMMDGQKVVKVFCHEEQNFAGFKQLNDSLRESAYNANRISNTIMPLTMAMGNLSYVLCAVVGALRRAEPPLVVVNFDTATTLLAVDDTGALVGGAILPGPQCSLASLVKNTAQLPQVELEAKPRRLLGTNTADCLHSGIVHGTSAMLDGMVAQFRAALHADTSPVIATGTLPSSVRDCCVTEITYRETLILDGLFAIWQRNTRR